VAVATAANSDHAPIETSGAASKNMPAARAGTPIVHPANTIVCSLRSRIVSGAAGGTWKPDRSYAQNHVTSGSRRASIPTTICARNPTRPKTP